MIIKCTKIIYISYFVSPLIAKRAEDYDNEMRAVRPRKLTFNNWKGFLNSISDSCVVGPVNVPECACQSRSFFEMQSVEGENSRWQMKIQRWKFQSNEGTKKGCLACTVANGGAAAALAAQAAIVKKLNIKSFFQAQFATDAVHPLAPCTLSLASCFNWIEGAPRDPPADANQFPRIFFFWHCYFVRLYLPATWRLTRILLTTWSLFIAILCALISHCGNILYPLCSFVACTGWQTH